MAFNFTPEQVEIYKKAKEQGDINIPDEISIQMETFLSQQNKEENKTKEAPLQERKSNLLRNKPGIKQALGFIQGAGRTVPGSDLLYATGAAGLDDITGSIKNIKKVFTGEKPETPKFIKNFVKKYNEIKGYSKKMEESAPAASLIGKVVGNVGLYKTGMEAMSGANLPGVANRLLNIAKSTGVGAALGQSERGLEYNPEELKQDAAVSAVFSTLGEVADLSKPLLQKVPKMLWKSVLSRKSTEMLKEGAIRQPMEETLVKKGIMPWFGLTNLSKKAAKQANILANELDDVLGKIKGKVKPEFVINKLNKVLEKYEQAGTLTNEVNQVKSVLNNYKNSLKSGWQDAMDANKAKRVLYSITKKEWGKSALDQIAPVRKEALQAQASGLREGIEDVAERTEGQGSKVAKLNEELGFFNNLAKSLEKSNIIQKAAIPTLAGVGYGAGYLTDKDKANELALLGLMLGSRYGRANLAGGMSKAINASSNLGALAPILNSIFNKE